MSTPSRQDRAAFFRSSWISAATRRSFHAFLRKSIVVVDGDCCCGDAFPTAVALIPAQPKRGENQKETTRGGKKSMSTPVKRTQCKVAVMATNQFRALKSSNPSRNRFLNEPNRAHYPIYFIQTDMPPFTIVVDSIPLLTGFPLFPSCCQAENSWLEKSIDPSSRRIYDLL